MDKVCFQKDLDFTKDNYNSHGKWVPIIILQGTSFTPFKVNQNGSQFVQVVIDRLYETSSCTFIIFVYSENQLKDANKMMPIRLDNIRLD